MWNPNVLSMCKKHMSGRCTCIATYTHTHTHTYIHKYVVFLVALIRVGLAQAHPNYGDNPETVTQEANVLLRRLIKIQNR